MDNAMLDEVIKRRLLIDGDGLGDDRRIVALTKSFITWCNAVDETKDENTVSRKRLVGQLNQVAYSAKRTHCNIIANQKAKIMYTDLGEEVRKEIDNTRSEIVDAKELLVEATKTRKHALEFDALAKLIESKPDRRQTEARVKELRQEIEIYEKRRDTLDMRLESRKKQMFIIATAVDQVEEVLKESDDYPSPDQGEQGIHDYVKMEMLKQYPKTIESTPMDLGYTIGNETPPSSPSESGSDPESEDVSPMQLSPEGSPDPSTMTGTVTDASGPLVEKKEKYDDLSEASEEDEDD